MSLCYPKQYRILKRRDFLCIQKYGTKKRYQNLAFQKLFLKNNTQTKLGITVSKKHGKAILRNRFKRRIRELFRSSYHKIPKPLYLIVYPISTQSLTNPFETLQSDWELFLHTLIES